MKTSDYRHTYRFMNSYGQQMVKAIKSRIKADGLIKTGALYNSINYEIKDTGKTFEVIFKMGDGNYVHGSGLPSEYGFYLDQGTIYIRPYYFFTAPVPGLTQRDFANGLRDAMALDISVWASKQLKS